MPTDAIGSGVAAVWSRDINPARLAGRPKIIVAIRRVMDKLNYVEHLRLANFIESPNLSGLVDALSAALREFCRGRLPSLQCLLFANTKNHRSLFDQIQESRALTLYCDGVRAYYFLKSLGEERKRFHIVVDLDDLMSRRMEQLGNSGVGLSLGYLNHLLPGWGARLLTHPIFARIVAAWESTALRKVEDDLGHWSNTVVLVSPVEGEELRRRYANHRARVVVIPPFTDIVSSPKGYSHFERFIFIGTDSLPQNHSTITYLIEIWKTRRPKLELHVFGNMSQSWTPPEGVVFRGYAPSLEDVYAEGAVLLAPGVLRGGIKTKVVEAFANGCAVVGNSITFEGLQLDRYPLRVDSRTDLEDIVLSPHNHLDSFRRASVLGQKYISENLTWAKFSESWRLALQPMPLCNSDRLTRS